MTLEKGNKKTIRGWIFYDWANSVYNLVISSAIFPIFYDTVTTNEFLKNYNREHGLKLEEVPEGVNVVVDFFGTQLSPSVLMSFTLSFSFLIVSILSPMLSGVADLTGSKKKFMKFFCYLGATSCSLLFLFKEDTITLGLMCFMFAGIGFYGSQVFYNSYLPDIAFPDQQDSVSAKDSLKTCLY